MKKRKKKKKNSKQFNRQFKKTFFTKKSAIIIVCTVIILSAFWGAYQKVERKAVKYQKTIDELKTEVKNLNQTNKTLEKEKNNLIKLVNNAVEKAIIKMMIESEYSQYEQQCMIEGAKSIMLDKMVGVSVYGMLSRIFPTLF